VSGTYKPPIPAPINWILGLWALVAISLPIWFLAINWPLDDWWFILLLLAGAFVALCSLVLWLTWLVIRYVVSGVGTRTGVALLGPPALFVSVWFIRGG
jgi:hypothetical protein